jgi:hypothetical protein
MLPKIMARTHKQYHCKNKTSKENISGSKTEPLAIFKQDGMKEVTKTEDNVVNFDSSYYRRHFRQQLEQEANSMEFRIPCNFSHNNLLMARDI